MKKALRQDLRSIIEAADTRPMEVQLKLPTRKLGADDPRAKAWAQAEKRALAAFERNLEQRPIKTDRAPNVTIQVTKSAFMPLGGGKSSYGIVMTLNLSGQGLDQNDPDIMDDMMKALDKRAESAFDATVLEMGDAGQVMFASSDWKSADLDVLT